MIYSFSTIILLLHRLYSSYSGSAISITSTPSLLSSPTTLLIQKWNNPKDKEFDFLLPLESTSGLDGDVTFSYHKGSFTATLRELTMPISTSGRAVFGFRKGNAETKGKGIVSKLFAKRNHCGILEILESIPLRDHYRGITIFSSATNLDAMDGVEDKSGKRYIYIFIYNIPIGCWYVWLIAYSSSFSLSAPLILYDICIDPFIIVSAIKEDGSKITLHTTEVIAQNLNPEFAPFTLDYVNLGNSSSIHQNSILPFVYFRWGLSITDRFILYLYLYIYIFQEVEWICISYCLSVGITIKPETTIWLDNFQLHSANWIGNNPIPSSIPRRKPSKEIDLYIYIHIC